MNDDGEVEALRSLVRLPWITQQHFVGMLQARRIDQVDVYFLFEWPWFYLFGGLGKRGDSTWHPAVKHQRPAAKTTNSNCCDRAAAQVK